MNEMYVYTYSGNVYDSFGNFIDFWNGETSAVNKRKAISNLKYRFRKEYCLPPYAALEFEEENMRAETLVYSENEDPADEYEQLTLFDSHI